MRLKITKSKNARSFYVIESFRKDGKNSSRVVEKLGTEQELKAKLGADTDVEQWARDYVSRLNEELKAQKELERAIVTLDPSTPYGADDIRVLSAGGLMLYQALYSMGYREIAEQICRRHKTDFNLEQLLVHFVCALVLSAADKKHFLSCDILQEKFLDLMQSFPDRPEYRQEDLYQGLQCAGDEFEFIQSFIYRYNNRREQSSPAVLYHCAEEFCFRMPITDEQGTSLLIISCFFLLITDDKGQPVACICSPTNSGLNKKEALYKLTQILSQDFGLKDVQLRPRTAATEPAVKAAVAGTQKILRAVLHKQTLFGDQVAHLKGMFVLYFLALRALWQLEQQISPLLPKPVPADKLIEALSAIQVSKITDDIYTGIFNRTAITDALESNSGMTFCRTAMRYSYLQDMLQLAKQGKPDPERAELPAAKHTDKDN